jgi:hypothetical protein
MPGIPVNRALDPRRLIGKNGGPRRRRSTKMSIVTQVLYVYFIHKCRSTYDRFGGEGEIVLSILQFISGHSGRDV